MQACKAFFALVVLGAVCAQTAAAQSRFGAQGAEAGLNRMQQWPVPLPDPDTAAHASTQNVLRRAQMPQPDYRALAGWLVARGFVGHSASPGARWLWPATTGKPVSSIVAFGALVKTGPAIALMLVALLTLDDR
jgi:hypothetical protein